MTNTIQKKRAKQETHRYLAESLNAGNTLAITLTQKQIVDRQRIDDIVSSQNVRHFLNFLNREVYGRQRNAKKQKINLFIVRETSFNDRHHLHLIVESPFHIPLEDFRAAILRCWMKTKFGYFNVKVEEVHDLSNWTDYMLKQKTKGNWYDAIDWENCHLKTAED
jgi:hypothetical protein